MGSYSDASPCVLHLGKAKDGEVLTNLLCYCGIVTFTGVPINDQIINRFQ